MIELPEKNCFQEGNEACCKWIGGITDYPDNPYEMGTAEYAEWDIGFDDALAYFESDC